MYGERLGQRRYRRSPDTLYMRRLSRSYAAPCCEAPCCEACGSRFLRMATATGPASLSKHLCRNAPRPGRQHISKRMSTVVVVKTSSISMSLKRAVCNDMLGKTRLISTRSRSHAVCWHDDTLHAMCSLRYARANRLPVPDFVAIPVALWRITACAQTPCPLDKDAQRWLAREPAQAEAQLRRVRALQGSSDAVAS